ncbi:MAG: hypothetical protein E6J41_24315 [Chloroflexi bacterium]|nr:MAG: hypothetical protein E6J41_24315 [Chloroflexota bacterium]
MSLPVRPSSGHEHDPEALRPPAELVDVRLMGQPAAVELVARELRRVLPVTERLDDRERRNGKGIRRYLTVVLPAGADVERPS